MSQKLELSARDGRLKALDHLGRRKRPSLIRRLLARTGARRPSYDEYLSSDMFMLKRMSLGG